MKILLILVINLRSVILWPRSEKLLWRQASYLYGDRVPSHRGKIPLAASFRWRLDHCLVQLPKHKSTSLVLSGRNPIDIIINGKKKTPIFLHVPLKKKTLFSSLHFTVQIETYDRKRFIISILFKSAQVFFEYFGLHTPPRCKGRSQTVFRIRIRIRFVSWIQGRIQLLMKFAPKAKKIHIILGYLTNLKFFFILHI